jgi:MFS transporter, MHS family, shikimate and dehydroshikimate transport protein
LEKYSNSTLKNFLGVLLLTNQVRKTTSPKTVAFASLVGTTIEWYDYFIYGTLAALVFNKLFFPSISSLAGTLAAFATFAVGFFARPIGGIVFGHFGDKFGRKTTLVTSLLIMGLGTFLIGLLPTYNSIGVWAPILLIVLRLMQGIAIGGEWGGAALMAVEHAPKGKRGLFGSAAQMGAPGGLILSTLVVSFVTKLPDTQFLSWGWRLPFLASLLLVIIGLVVRLRLEESQAFKQVKMEKNEAKIPVIDLFKSQPKNIFIAAGLGAANNVSFYTVATFTISYATQYLGMSRDTMLSNMFIVSIVYFITIPIFAAISDRVGRRPMIITSIIITALIAFPYFSLLHTKNNFLILIAMVLTLSVIQSAAYAPQSAYFSELFDVKVRYTGASLGYNLTTMVFGGTAPFVATALFAWSGEKTWSISLYIIAVCIISLTAVLIAKETNRRPTKESSVELQQENMEWY